MEEYLEFLIASMMTACTVALVGLVITGIVVMYKIIKEEY